MKTYDYVSEKVNKGILFSFVAAAVSFLVLIFAVIGLFKSIGAENAVQEIEKNFEEVADGGKITDSGEIAPKTGKSRPVLPTEENFSKKPYRIRRPSAMRFDYRGSFNKDYCRWWSACGMRGLLW